VSQITFDDLFAEDKKKVEEKPKPSPLYNEICDLLQTGESSALEICEKLIASEKISSERFSSNKPKSYGKVCSILDSMVSQGNLLFVEDKDKKDRIYQLKVI
jgi:hypothetical protein